MVLPLAEVLFLTLKTTARPISTFLKARLKYHGWGRNVLITMGNKAHNFEIKVTRANAN